MISVLALSLSFGAVLPGCATIIKGSSQVVTVTSEPSNADVLIDGNNMGKTPLSVNLKKNTYSSITVKKSGYNSQVRQMQKIL